MLTLDTPTNEFRAVRFALGGEEGVGKSTLAAQLPMPIVIDGEDSTTRIHAWEGRRIPGIKSWNGLIDTLQSIRKCKDRKINGSPFRSLVLDTINWAQGECGKAVATSKDKQFLNDIAYSKGDRLVADRFIVLLDLLREIQQELNVHVCLIGHVDYIKAEDTELVEDWHRLALSLNKYVRNLVYQWAEAVLIAGFKSELKSNSSGVKKGVGKGDKRLLYTVNTDACKAKNRFGLKPVLPMAYSEIRHIFEPPKKGKADAKAETA